MGAVSKSRVSRGRSSYLPTLDGWRAVAILMVLFCHASHGIGIYVANDYFGIPGVQIFFGLSGFLITSLLLRQEARLGSVSLAGFYTRRVFRIVPAAAVYLGTIGILSLIGLISITFRDWITALLFVANYLNEDPNWYVQHFWSLAVEEHFYLIWPTVLVLVRSNRKRLAIALGAAILVGIWRLVDFKFHWFWPENAFLWTRRTDVQADNILFGVSFALALADKEIGPRLQAFLQKPATTFVAIGVFATTVILAPHVDWKLSLILLSIRAASVPVMVLSTLHYPQGQLGRILELRPIRFVGLISYSLYLWQELFLAWEPNARLSVVQWFPFNVAMAFLWATLSFYLIETPLIRWGHRLSERWLRPIPQRDQPQIYQVN